uniref:Uncharacterized protein n=1 Tax=Eutreptiella gymnastica TaxID=73025 RepID=A0A7S4CAM7_9EUGL|mmetsp:Transcript_460/g.673  ORF Transcript_460/g.673 Transcript_460/m.673 type:complete len:136 (-) Transcript_460:16-423(-)
MDPQAFEGFVQHGLMVGADGCARLKFSVDAERTMYFAVPLDIPLVCPEAKMYRADTGVPEIFMYSTRHHFLTRGDIIGLRAVLRGATFRGIDEGHFWPLERPEACGEEMCKGIDFILQASNRGTAPCGAPVCKSL